MSFGRTRIFRLLRLSIALTLGALFVACLDIPSNPDSTAVVETVKVMVYQNDIYDSTFYKINPAESASLVAKVYPASFENELEFYWYFNDELVDSGTVYSIRFQDLSNIPNILFVTDKGGNSRTVRFTTILNSAPIIDSKTIPADGDSIEATENTPVLFQWNTFDSNDDKLTHILEIDSTSYNVGPLTKISQSGFEPGEHSFRVIATDSFGDSDTLSWVRFTITNSREDSE